jgi:hypothetical protein
MTAIKKHNDDYIISYLILRQLIGILGLLLPFALLFGNKLLGSEVWLQPSISHYYYSYMHIAFVGVLCVLGGFLITYKGKSRLENRVSNFSGAFAFGVAIFPTGFDGYQATHYLNPTIWLDWFKWIHFGSAGLLFACFAFFCLKIFQESDAGKTEANFDAKKIFRNKIYKTCGWGIVASIVLIGICTFYEHKWGATTFTIYSTFIFETTALLFFGNSWLLKGSLNWKHTDSAVLKTIVAPVR